MKNGLVVEPQAHAASRVAPQADLAHAKVRAHHVALGGRRGRRARVRVRVRVGGRQHAAQRRVARRAVAGAPLGAAHAGGGAQAGLGFEPLRLQRHVRSVQVGRVGRPEPRARDGQHERLTDGAGAAQSALPAASNAVAVTQAPSAAALPYAVTDSVDVSTPGTRLRRVRCAAGTGSIHTVRQMPAAAVLKHIISEFSLTQLILHMRATCKVYG